MKYSLSEAKRIATLRGWSQKLGYSKRELGIKTPKRKSTKNPGLKRRIRIFLGLEKPKIKK